MSSIIMFKLTGLALMFAAVVLYVVRRYGSRPAWLRESPAVMILVGSLVLALALGAWVVLQSR